MSAFIESLQPQDITVAQTLDELLSYDDLPFVLCAYQTLLGRMPDPEGLNYYLGQFRAGYSKLGILRQLRKSSESFVIGAYQTSLGRNPDPEGLDHYLRLLCNGFSKKRIKRELRRSPEGMVFQRQKSKGRSNVFPDLDKAILRYQRGRLPLVGWLFRLVQGTDSDLPDERKLRAIENQLARLSDESKSCFNQLFRLIEESNARFNQMDTALSGLQTQTAQQSQMIFASMGIGSALSSALLSGPEGLDKLTPTGRDIYFKLKAASNAKKARKL